ncbi:hypothetical protein ACHWQZ_G008900 [Mnemiopsis leidyi]
MNIQGSPTSIELFGLQGSSGNSPDLFENQRGSPDKEQQYTTPSKKRPCFRSPKCSTGYRNELISPLSAAISNSVQGVYCTQEIKEQDSNFQSDVWKILKALREKTEILLPYNIKNILQGRNLYRGKVAHISAIVKSVEAVSQKDTSIVLCDNTGEIKAAVHNKVIEKYGSLLEPGVGLLLRQCTVFSFITVQKYVNITLPNIVHVYNSSSLHPDQSVVDKHILEVSEINVQKIENPDTENQTPNITLNTPNRPPPPRPSRNMSRTNTPQNNSRTNTPQYKPSPYNNNASTSTHQTPQKSWTPQRNRFPQHNTTQPQQHNTSQPQQHNTSQSQQHNTTQPQQHNTSQPQQHNTSQPWYNKLTPQQTSHGGSKRNSEEEEGDRKRVKTTPPPGSINLKKSNNLSPKEQEEIAKLLEDIDDSFFDDF